ncbi:MAG: carbonic anhydrase [Polyangia bacterium]
MPDHLLHGYARFRKQYFASEWLPLQRLATHGQRPSALFIGCSDSRVIPELLTSAAPGDLFVVRNIANQVPALEHPDASVGAAIEYAVAILKVRHIIVCGHYGCGGVKATLDGRDAVRALPSLNEWLEGVEPAVARVRAESLVGDVALARAVEENVLLQINNLLSFGPVQTALEAQELALHGWVYDLLSSRLSIYDTEQDTFTPADEIGRQGALP